MIRAGCGTVFELTRLPGGGWAETSLYEFQGGTDGAFPWAGLIFDQAGNLFGTTLGGGFSQACCGTVFELSPPSQPGGAWTETILYRFTAYTDGALPEGRLIFDRAGNLYGTAEAGGIGFDCCGTVFELSPPGEPGGGWIETTLHIFRLSQNSVDGENPSTGLTFDKSGSLYGTTQLGGDSGLNGTVFRLRPPKNPGGKWTESVYSFKGGTNDGYAPYGDLIWVRGILIGTTSGGGANDSGTAFQVSSTPTGIAESVLYDFQSGRPYSGLVLDSTFNLYGTTLSGGGGACQGGCGTVFQLMPPSQPGGVWTEKTIYEFQGSSDGAEPLRSPLLLMGRHLVGMTARGGSDACNVGGSKGCGTVFAVPK